jgi:hypothetical protein
VEDLFHRWQFREEAQQKWRSKREYSRIRTGSTEGLRHVLEIQGGGGGGEAETYLRKKS